MQTCLRVINVRAMKRLLFVLFAVSAVVCQEMSQELKEKIKEAFCEARCLEKPVQNFTCGTSKCNCFLDLSEKKLDFSKLSTAGSLSEPVLLCKDVHLLSIEWEVKQPLIFLVEYRTSNNKKWKFENKTSCATIRIDKLDADTNYQIRLWGVSPQGDLFGPSNSIWVKTNSASYKPKAVIKMNVVEWILHGEDYTAIIKWEPGEDPACFYDFVWSDHSETPDYKQKQIRFDNELFQTALPNLVFGINYTVAIASKSEDANIESNKTEITINTPTCLEAYSNLTKCYPPEPQNLQVEEELVNYVDLENSTYTVKVNWEKPKLIPDSYIVHIYVGNINEPTYLQNVGGNATGVLFRNVSVGEYFHVGVIARSEGGNSSMAVLIRQLKPHLHFPSSKSSWSNSIHIPIILGSIAGIVGFGLIIVLFLYRRCSFKLSKRQSDSMISKYYSDSYNEKFAPSLTNMTMEYYIPEIVDDEWQLDPEKVAVDKLLGEGAFGIVHKGLLQRDNGEELEIAIKMLKGNPTGEEIRQFESELEIMKSVGSHPHLVSLLGCCPRLEHFGPALVVEYCAKGDLQNYLRDIWEHISTQAPGMRYVNTPSLPEDVKSENHFSNKVYELFDDSLLEPRDLLSFARQIAMGMEYLSSLRVVHRDLAARNVLMCDNGTVKVADFGLSRDVYQDNIYLKTGAGKLPVKWMAIESLSHQQYTTQSDVWSFGVLLWEIVTLGGNPYATISAQDLLSFLRSGYRMECPKNCSEELYEIMRLCWKESPKDRPMFNDLRDMLEKLLENENCYISLDVRY